VAGYLLDADAVIDIFKGVASTASLVDELFRANASLCTCDVVIAEVHVGLHTIERERGEALLASLRYLPCSPAGARQAGLWRYEFRRRGQQLATTDCLIAAIAHEHRATLITGNARHFPMAELNVLPLPR
jgi:predicted nucleic acid-binding protein